MTRTEVMTCMTLHFKTELCDGCCHMTAHEYHEHKINERDEAQRIRLQKLINNPILKDTVRETIRKALVDLDSMKFYRSELIKYRNAYFELKDKYEKGE